MHLHSLPQNGITAAPQEAGNISACSRTRITTTTHPTNPSLFYKPTSSPSLPQRSPAASLLAGEGMQVNALPAKLTVTPGDLQDRILPRPGFL